MYFIALNSFKNYKKNFKNILSAQCIMMLKNQSIKLPLKSIRKHAQRFNKACSAKNKLKKSLIKKQKLKYMVIINIFFKKD